MKSLKLNHCVFQSSSYTKDELDIDLLYEHQSTTLDVDNHHLLIEYIQSPEWDVIEIRMYEDMKVRKRQIHRPIKI